MLTATLKIFGTGQVTLPKAWRDKVNAENFLAMETPQGLLIKPLVETFFYEEGEQFFGLNFPTGIDAKELAKKLEKANGEI